VTARVRDAEGRVLYEFSLSLLEGETMVWNVGAEPSRPEAVPQPLAQGPAACRLIDANSVLASTTAMVTRSARRRLGLLHTTVQDMACDVQRLTDDEIGRVAKNLVEMTGVEMDMFDLMFRTLLGFALFVLATAFAIVAAPILLPTLAILAARREKPEGRERHHRPFLRKAQRITVSA
jgi:hypothetical protein